MIKNEDLVKNMINNFQKLGLDILYAKHTGFKKPTKIQDVAPDVIGWDPSQELYHVGIITDPSTISSDSTSHKMQVLGKLMMGVGSSEGKRLPLYLGFPKECESAVDKKLQDTEASTQENIVKMVV